jgi:hypothetical protein
VRQQSHRGRLPVRAGHLHDGDVRIAHGRLVAGLDRDQTAPGFGDRSIGRAPEHGGHPAGDLVRQRLGGRAPAPRERDTIWSRSGPAARARRVAGAARRSRSGA